MQVNATANKPQGQFLAMPQKFRAFVAGFGSGKTWVGSMAQCKHYWEHPGINQGYFARYLSADQGYFLPDHRGGGAFNGAARGSARG